jgi:alpha-beta hydrolase superfamily lysophospholipase
MIRKSIKIDQIPAVLWGEESERLYIFAHGKQSCKEEAAGFAEIATERNFQVLSFDFSRHGERKDDPQAFDVFSGVRDLQTVWRHAERNWGAVSLYAISIGAYFSLLAYKDYPLKNCLFLSPILDMQRLIKNMMKWSGVNEETLKEKKRIPTSMGEALDWEYYCYAKENPIQKWNPPTAILYGSKDNLTEQKVTRDFAERFEADLTVFKEGEHYFHTPGQLAFLTHWLKEHVISG